MSAHAELLSVRDLSVSFSRVGNVQVAQGDLAGALKSYQDSRDIIGQRGQWILDCGYMQTFGLK